MSYRRMLLVVALGALLVTACAPEATDDQVAALEQELAAERDRAVLLEGDVT
jgi:outer membrane murein-binding lipoprotein Lpp